jgi:hypothetical protein
MEYQFKTFGGITVIFIEVKLDIGSATERQNCIAQVIAECDACAWLNLQNAFYIPIIAAILLSARVLTSPHRGRGGAPAEIMYRQLN